jgi:hypothetical protein
MECARTRVARPSTKLWSTTSEVTLSNDVSASVPRRHVQIHAVTDRDLWLGNTDSG